MNAKSIVDTLLEHCGSCPEDFDPQELAMGVKVEMEHTDDPKEAQRIAIDHLKERGDYYSFGKKKGMFPELGKAKAMFMAGGSMGAMTGGSTGAQM